jgi:hypothetical protein
VASLYASSFEVDPNRMTLTMAEEDRFLLIQHIRDFVKVGPGGIRRSLREFLQLAGWINWLLNVFPLLKPCLSNLYAETAGKTEMNARMHVNIDGLDWFPHHLVSSDGVYVLKAFDWHRESADSVVFTDASLQGLSAVGVRLPNLCTVLEPEGQHLLRIARTYLGGPHCGFFYTRPEETFGLLR